MTDFFQASYFISEAITLLGITLNAFQILHTIRNNRKATPFDLFIFSLSVADLLSSSVALLFMIYWHLIHNSIIKNNPVIDIISIVLLQYCILSSMFHLVFIAILRVTAVVSPFKFRHLITSNLPYTLIVIIWVLSLVSSVVNVFLVALDAIGYVVSTVEALLVVIYITICCAVKKQDDSMTQLATCRQQRPPIFRHTLLHSVYVTSAFILCTLPATLFSIGAVKRVNPSYVYEWVRWMFYLNPSVDSLLYFYFAKKLSRTHRIRISFASQWSCNSYNLESARKSNDFEMTKQLSKQKFTLSATELNQRASKQ